MSYNDSHPPKKPAYVYMLELENGAYYTGYTTNLSRRFQMHADAKGAKITRSFRPIRMLAAWRTPDRSTALRLEAAIKKLSRIEKEALVKATAVGRRFGLYGVRRIKMRDPHGKRSKNDKSIDQPSNEGDGLSP